MLAWLKDKDGKEGRKFVVWYVFHLSNSPWRAICLLPTRVNSADGKGKFTQATSELDTKLDCEPKYLYFVDMNADGVEDFVCVRKDGKIEISINQDNGVRLKREPPTFVHKGTSSPTSGDVDRDRVVIGDIDGDGRADYGVVQSSGEILFWRNNGGTKDLPVSWQSMGSRSPNRGMEDQDGFRFEDINGDGRDDLLFVASTGATTTWTNARSCKKGKEGNGLNVAWRQGYKKGEGTGPTHSGVPWAVTKDDKDVRRRIHFARIYGDTPVTGNLAKQDYILMQHEKKDKKHLFTMRVWKNQGYGGTKLLADGNKYCNVMGHKDGAVDYVWAWGGGAMQLWASRGKKFLPSDDPDGWWDYKGYMWRPPSEMSRRDLHLADWDGDGLCDIIYVDPDHGAVKVWINQIKNGMPTFTERDAPALRCGQKKGLGMRDSKSKSSAVIPRSTYSPVPSFRPLR